MAEVLAFRDWRACAACNRENRNVKNALVVSRNTEEEG